MTADASRVIVCFTPTTQKGFWRWVVRKHPKFAHCFVVFYSVESDTWNWLEYNNCGFKFISAKDEDATEMLAVLVGHCTCIEIKPNNTFRRFYCFNFSLKDFNFIYFHVIYAC